MPSCISYYYMYYYYYFILVYPLLFDKSLCKVLQVRPILYTILFTIFISGLHNLYHHAIAVVIACSWERKNTKSIKKTQVLSLDSHDACDCIKKKYGKPCDKWIVSLLYSRRQQSCGQHMQDFSRSVSRCGECICPWLCMLLYGWKKVAARKTE